MEEASQASFQKDHGFDVVGEDAETSVTSTGPLADRTALARSFTANPARKPRLLRVFVVALGRLGSHEEHRSTALPGRDLRDELREGVPIGISKVVDHVAG